MFWIGLIIGFTLGVVALGILRYVRNNDDECGLCKSNFNSTIRGLEDTIHGLKSTKGRLSQELQAMAFRNAGYKAR
jgi:hypothetical protein